MVENGGGGNLWQNRDRKLEIPRSIFGQDQRERMENGEWRMENGEWRRQEVEGRNRRGMERR